jgi:hypothetical protein
MVITLILIKRRLYTLSSIIKKTDTSRLKIKLHHSNSSKYNERNCPEVGETDSTKYSGILIDKNMKRSNHCINLTKKMTRLTGIIRKPRSSFNLQALKMVYYSLIHSIIQYGIVVCKYIKIKIFNFIDNKQESKASDTTIFTKYIHID